ncbi:MAG TPA: hypothetical protein VN860_07900 [Candidatus Acidoferrales bacterium]|nr:hypothetical protein [Candidatus Acidoferrales bacterium]
MKILAATFVGSICVMLAVVATSGSSIAASTGPTSMLAPGDQLVYEIAIELQQHHITTTTASKTEDRAAESSAQGTETFTIYAVGKDGVAFATVDASFKGTENGKPFESHTMTTAKVLPDGRLRVKDQFGLGISDAMSFANTTTAEMARHVLRLGAGWTTPLTTPYARVIMVRKVANVKTYQGYRAYEVQSLGAGDLIKTTDGLPATGTLTITGTSYYDKKDHLFIGESVRTLMVVQPATSSHDNYSATMQVVLDAWTHGTPPPVAPSAAPPVVSASPASTAAPLYASPAPIPSIYGSTPVPTVTPRLGP